VRPGQISPGKLLEPRKREIPFHALAGKGLLLGLSSKRTSSEGKNEGLRESIQREENEESRTSSRRKSLFYH